MLNEGWNEGGRSSMTSSQKLRPTRHCSRMSGPISARGSGHAVRKTGGRGRARSGRRTLKRTLGVQPFARYKRDAEYGVINGGL